MALVYLPGEKETLIFGQL